MLNCIAVLGSLRSKLRLVVALDGARLAVVPSLSQEARLMACSALNLNNMRGPRLEAHPTCIATVMLGGIPTVALSFR